MKQDEVERLLVSLRDGKTTLDDALRELSRVQIQDLGFAQLDTHREMRQGHPEVIYGEGKTPAQIVEIAQRLVDTTSGAVLVTRASPAATESLAAAFPSAEVHPNARLVVVRASKIAIPGTVAIVTGGTSDLPVAEEAAATGTALGIQIERVIDVGAAGLHRILAQQDRLQNADVVIVIAGMEGALATIVGGLTGAPVVAVPTSVGYGASFDGLAALLAMLNSCAAGVVVTNIDNGFGAAMFALRLLQRGTRQAT